MTTPLSISSKASDVELTRVVAVHCTELTRVDESYSEAPFPGQEERRPVRRIMYRSGDGSRCYGESWLPAYATDLNALLPLLEAWNAESGDVVIHSEDGGWSATLWNGTESHVTGAPAAGWSGKVPQPLARALCLALLASRGFTILP